MIHIHLIGIGQVEQVQKSIESMQLDTLPYSYRLSICNNGPMGDYNALLAYGDVHDVGNIGVAAAWNYGITIAKQAGADSIMLTPNDSLYSPGVFHSWITAYYEQQRPEILGIRHRVHVTHKKTEEKKGRRIDSAIYPISVFDQVGFFDEDFLLCWYEDLDFEYRLRAAGISFNLSDFLMDVYPNGGQAEALRLGMIKRKDLIRVKLRNMLHLWFKWFWGKDYRDNRRMREAKDYFDRRIQIECSRLINYVK